MIFFATPVMDGAQIVFEIIFHTRQINKHVVEYIMIYWDVLNRTLSPINFGPYATTEISEVTRPRQGIVWFVLAYGTTSKFGSQQCMACCRQVAKV